MVTSVNVRYLPNFLKIINKYFIDDGRVWFDLSSGKSKILKTIGVSKVSASCFEVWIYMHTKTNGKTYFNLHDSGTPTNIFYQLNFLDGSPQQLQFKYSTYTKQAAQTTALMNRWSHYSINMLPSSTTQHNIYFYRDGIQIAGLTDTSNSNIFTSSAVVNIDLEIYFDIAYFREFRYGQYVKSLNLIQATMYSKDVGPSYSVYYRLDENDGRLTLCNAVTQFYDNVVAVTTPRKDTVVWKGLMDPLILCEPGVTVFNPAKQICQIPKKRKAANWASISIGTSTIASCNPYTFSAWIYVTSTTSSGNIIDFQHYDNRHHILRWNNAYGYETAFISQTCANYINQSVLTLAYNKWVNIRIGYSSYNSYIYYNTYGDSRYCGDLCTGGTLINILTIGSPTFDGYISMVKMINTLDSTVYNMIDLVFE